MLGIRKIEICDKKEDKTIEIIQNVDIRTDIEVVKNYKEITKIKLFMKEMILYFYKRNVEILVTHCDYETQTNEEREKD